eukprot:573350-Pyramimonas_sp.AAC.1
MCFGSLPPGVDLDRVMGCRTLPPPPPGGAGGGGGVAKIASSDDCCEAGVRDRVDGANTGVD